MPTYSFGAALPEICAVALVKSTGSNASIALIIPLQQRYFMRILSVSVTSCAPDLLVIPLKLNKDRRTYAKYACKFLLTVDFYSTLST